MNVASPNPSEAYLHRINLGFKHQLTSKIYQEELTVAAVAQIAPARISAFWKPLVGPGVAQEA
jgi:hypothetical protein